MEDIDNLIDQEKFNLWKVEKQQRLRIAMAVVPAIISLVAIIFINVVPDNLAIYFPVSKSFISVLVPLTLLISGVALLLIYLQTGFNKNTNADYLKYENELINLRNRIYKESTSSNIDLDSLKSEIKTIKEEINSRVILSDAVPADYRDELVSILKDEIIKESKSKVASEIMNNIETKFKKNNDLHEIEVVFSRTLDRLYREITALSRRGNLNLVLGIFTTIIGLATLGYFVLKIDPMPEDKVSFIAHFIPRLSLVVLIEVFAYFFLRLYKSSLSEIKYFQNEMTNAEAKLAAIKCSIMKSDAPTTSSVIQTLAATERNAILEKDQTTAEIEKAKIEQQNISTISDKVASILSLKK